MNKNDKIGFSVQNYYMRKEQFFDKSSEREYVALVWGHIDEEQGTVEGAIGRHPKNRLQNTVFIGDDFNFNVDISSVFCLFSR